MGEYTTEQLLHDLVALPSINADMPGGSGEGKLAAYVARLGLELGLDVDQQDALPGRPNVRLTLPGSSRGRRAVLFDVHLDTVPPASPEELTPRTEAGRLYGRGACDTKGSLAAALTALSRLAARPAARRLGADIVLLATIDEEYLKRGVEAAVRADWLAPGGNAAVLGAVVGEPTNLSVVAAHKGAVRFRLRTVGRAAHTSRPGAGVNAIYHMVEVIVAVRAWAADALPRRTHPLLDAPTLTVSTIRGGVSANIVPDQCTVEIDRRTLPDEEPDEVLEEIDSLLAALSKSIPGLRAERELPFLAERGLEVPLDSPLVEAARAACRESIGRDDVRGVAFGTDGTWLSGRAGVPTIVLGPGDVAQAHTTGEWIDLEQVAQAADVYERLATRLAGE